MKDILIFKESLIALNKAIEEGANPSIIDKVETDHAYVNIRNMALITIEDYFLYFASINLINSYVKKEYAEFKKYDFKQYIAKGIEALIDQPVERINFSYNKQLTIIDIKGIQFSFHNSEITELMKNNSYKELEWEGIRLQPVSLEIYNYAKNLDNLSNTSVYGGLLSELYKME